MWHNLWMLTEFNPGGLPRKTEVQVDQVENIPVGVGNYYEVVYKIT